MNIRAILAGLAIGAGFVAYSRNELTNLSDPDTIIPAIIVIILTAIVVGAVHGQLAQQKRERE